MYKNIKGNKISDIFEKSFSIVNILSQKMNYIIGFYFMLEWIYLIRFAISIDLKDFITQVLIITLTNTETDDYLIIY